MTFVDNEHQRTTRPADKQRLAARRHVSYARRTSTT